MSSDPFHNGSEADGEIGIPSLESFGQDPEKPVAENSEM